MRFTAICTLAAVCGTLLSACESKDVRESLGLNRHAPDEFRVVSRPPLSVPPEFNLTPPGQEETSFGSSSAVARELVTGNASAENLDQAARGLPETAATPINSSPLASTGEERLLKRLGTTKSDPNIRQRIREETPKEPPDPGLIERLRGEGAGDPVVDAEKEAVRIEANKEGGKPVNEGEVPVVDPKEKSTLERLFE